METIKIKRAEIKQVVDGRWLINGRTYEQASKPEKEFFNNLVREAKALIERKPVKSSK